MDVVRLWRMSKAHSCLPYVLTAVNGVDIFCCVLWEKQEVGLQKARARADSTSGTQGSSAPLFSSTKETRKEASRH